MGRGTAQHPGTGQKRRTDVAVRWRHAEGEGTEGTAVKQGVPGWSLVEIGPEPEPRNRRITIRELPGGGR